MNIGLILVILIVLAIFGGIPFGVYQGSYGMHYGGGLGLVVLILVVLLVLGRL